MAIPTVGTVLRRAAALNLGNGTSPRMNLAGINQLVSQAAANAIGQPPLNGQPTGVLPLGPQSPQTPPASQAHQNGE